MRSAHRALDPLGQPIWQPARQPGGERTAGHAHNSTFNASPPSAVESGATPPAKSGYIRPFAITVGEDRGGLHDPSHP